MRKLHELMNMAGRVVAITGGVGHIGRAMAETLAEMCASIVLIDRNADACDGAAQQLAHSSGAATLAIVADVSRPEELERIPAQIHERFHRLDVLIHCAAFVGTDSLIGWNTSFKRQSIDTWRACLDVNLTPSFLLTQKCVPLLEDSGNGSVINILSIYGVVGPDWRIYEGTEMGNPAAYAASKGGLLQLTRWMATTLAPTIRVNAITPGGVERGQDAGFRAKYVSRVPLGRMAIEEDFKGAVAYLASDMSKYVTGQNLVVDGGWTAW